MHIKRVKHLELLDQHGLTDNDYFIGASAAAVLYGMPIENADLDICVTEEAFERIGNADNALDVSCDDENSWCNFNIFWKYTVVVDGYRFLSWEGLKLFYEKLYNLMHKEKHKTRLAWMLAQENNA